MTMSETSVWKRIRRNSHFYISRKSYDLHGLTPTVNIVGGSCLKSQRHLPSRVQDRGYLISRKSQRHLPSRIQDRGYLISRNLDSRNPKSRERITNTDLCISSSIFCLSYAPERQKAKLTSNQEAILRRTQQFDIMTVGSIDDEGQRNTGFIS